MKKSNTNTVNNKTAPDVVPAEPNKTTTTTTTPSTTTLQTFSNSEFGNIRCITKDGEPWFVGKDVARILGYLKPLNAIATHIDKDDSLKQGLTDSLGRTQETILINESGLYSLILSSKLPSAKKFKKWVTSEVLPAIRKTGGYVDENRSDLFQSPPPVKRVARRTAISL